LLAAAAVAVCLAQPGPPDRTARVIEQYGQVSALSDNGARALFIGDAVKPQQMIVTGPDGYARFQVADGSTFEVFANSKAQFREHIGNLTDLLNVVIGQVKGYIQKLNGGSNPNQVSSPTAIISVRGTVFEVVVEDDEGTTFVSVEEGQVGVRSLTAPGAQVLLNPGESIRVTPNVPLAKAGIDKGSLASRGLRLAEDAVYQILWRRNAGGLSPSGVPGATTTGTNGDKGKGGSGGGTTAPGAPGAPGSTTTTTTGAPSAPGAPTAPGSPGH